MNRHRLLLAGVVWFVWAGAQVRAEEICAAAVETAQGWFSGLPDEDYAACVYRGIPFAQAPVGERRLRRPEPPSPHEGVFAAVQFGPACFQKPSMLNGGRAAAYTEDCLYLNVWRPAKSGRFPVLVWIYGGGFVGGAGSFDIYDGAHLAAREEVVVVTFNYRLGALGFLALPELKAEDPKGSTGNYGILDQVQALKWVRDHIAAFGGDPENVTVFGQSAGGMSICTLLVSPEAQGLFHHALIMSAPCRLMATLEQGYERSRKLVSAIGCPEDDLLACLRAKPMEAFAQKTPNDLFAGGVAWSPTVDGSVLPAMPLDLIQAGAYHQVPVMIGTTRDELRIYTMMLPGLGLWSRGTVNQLLKRLTGPNYAEIKAMYDYQDYRRPIDLAFAFGNQMVFDTPAFLMAEAMAGKQPVRLYRMDWDQTRFPHKMGAFHAIDVPFVFGALNPDARIAKLLASKKTYRENEALSYIMMDYVANFARTGDPNGPALPPWPAYTPERRERLYFDTEITHRPLTDQEVARYRWYAERDLNEVLTGPLSRRLAKRK